MTDKVIHCDVQCENCGIMLGFTFDINKREEYETILNSCHCGGKMKIIREEIWDDEVSV